MITKQPPERAGALCCSLILTVRTVLLLCTEVHNLNTMIITIIHAILQL